MALNSLSVWGHSHADVRRWNLEASLCGAADGAPPTALSQRALMTLLRPPLMYLVRANAGPTLGLVGGDDGDHPAGGASATVAPA